MKVAPAISRRIIKFAHAGKTQVVYWRPADQYQAFRIEILQPMLRGFQGVERDDRIDVGRRMLHQPVKHRIDDFRKTDSYRSMQLLLESRWAARRNRPAHIRTRVLDYGYERDEQVPDKKWN